MIIVSKTIVQNHLTESMSNYCWFLEKVRIQLVGIHIGIYNYNKNPLERNVFDELLLHLYMLMFNFI